MEPSNPSSPQPKTPKIEQAETQEIVQNIIQDVVHEIVPSHQLGKSNKGFLIFHCSSRQNS